MRRILSLLIFMVIFSFSGCQSAKTLEKGLSLYNNKNYTEAAVFLAEACDAGSVLGCKKLASIYKNGKGVSQNLNTAAKYLKIACKNGSTDSCKEYSKLVKLGYK